MMMLAASPAAAAERVELKFNVPDGVEGYTGKQPVTFGVPFPKNALKVTDGLQIVHADGSAAPGQFEVTATWTKKGEYVRWLLIDAIAELEQGKAKPLFLHFGSDVKTNTESAFKVEQDDDRVTIHTGAKQFYLDRRGGNIGGFLLNIGESENNGMRIKSFELEREGPVRAVVKLHGHYETTKDGIAAELITRIRFYAGCSFVRVYHTMVWLGDDKKPINHLTFSMNEPVEDAQITAGVDGNRVFPSAWNALTLQQHDWNQVSGNAVGEHLDGWIESRNSEKTIFASLRWPWQQYPMGLEARPDGKLSIRLLSPKDHISLKPRDAAAAPVMHNVESWDISIFREGVPGDDTVGIDQKGFPYLSPRGIAKTWEMLLWFDDADVSAETKNVFCQEPVLGYADPAFAVKAELPSPAAPVDEKAHPEIEEGIKQAFDWYTLSEADYGDFGWLNYGDIQWNFASTGVPIYRYWMNHGKGWSITPWALWLRSGDRRYWTHGTANSRHCMDLDMCHVPETERTADHKLRGGQNHYSALHWGYGPQVFSFYIDSEYLPYYWYMTGDERAEDVMRYHAEAMANWQSKEGWFKHFYEDPKKNIGRHLYAMMKNIGVLYEATWDPRLKAMLDDVLKLFELGQYEDGNFPHVKTNHYLDQPLNIAVRIYGWERMKPLVEGWHKVQGDPIRMGPTGNTGGPMSLWTAVQMYNHTGDQHYLNVAYKLARTQVECLVDGPTKWNGMSSIPAHEAGPVLRDYPILLDAINKLPADKQPTGFLPIQGVHANIDVAEDEKKDGWSSRKTVVMTLEEKDQDITLNLNWVGSVAEYQIKVVGPDGKVISDKTVEYPKRTASWQSSPIRIEIPKDGKTGVYTLHARVSGRDQYTPSLAANSSTGKLIHWIGEGECTVTPAWYAGQFFVKPKAGQTVSVSYINRIYIPGQSSLLDPSGNVVATSKVTQSQSAREVSVMRLFATSLPWGPPLTYKSDRYDAGLYSVIYCDNGDWHHRSIISGIEPFIATTADQWFDPTKHSDLDFDQVIK